MPKIKINLKKNGFTLIELMLVVSIILVLMGFLIPKFSSYEDKVKITKAVNAAKQIETAAMASYGDYNGKFDSTGVKDNINGLTSVQVDTEDITRTSDQLIEVNYQSDSKNYKVKINATANSYEVYSQNTGDTGTTEIKIYPK